MNDSPWALIGQVLVVALILGGIWVIKLFLPRAAPQDDTAGEDADQEPSPPPGFLKAQKIPLLCSLCGALGFYLIYFVSR